MENSEFEVFKKTWGNKIRQIKDSGVAQKENDKVLIRNNFRTERRTLEGHMTEEEVSRKRVELNSLYSDLNVALITATPLETTEAVNTSIGGDFHGLGFHFSRGKQKTNKYPKKEKKKPKKRAYI